jgi:hypothetical protein
MVMLIDTCWHLVHLAFNFQLTTHSKLTARTITTSTMLFIPIYMLLASISIIVHLTSTLVPFGLNICQRTFTLSSMVSDGYLSLDFHQDDFIEAYLVHNNWVLCYLTTYALIS